MDPLNLTLVEKFSEEHPQARKPLRTWVSVLRCAQWKRFADVKETFGPTDKVGDLYVFNIGGGKFRLIATINFAFETVRIERVMTHAEYSRLDLRKLRSG